jgi:hypothetical protein
MAQALLACGRVTLDAVDFRLAEAAVEQEARPDAAFVPSGDIGPIDEAVVLHVLRIRGFATPDGLTSSLGEFPADIIGELVDAGLVRYIEPRQMYGLLPDGKARHEELLESLADTSARGGLADPYERFLVLNDSFKALCTTWQMRGDQPNDHTDEDYDQACVEQLGELSAAVQPLIADLAQSIPRLARYGPRLSTASTNVANGDQKQFTGVMCESFHDVWMELHEDLVVLQRIDRTVEGSF